MIIIIEKFKSHRQNVFSETFSLYLPIFLGSSTLSISSCYDSVEVALVEVLKTAAATAVREASLEKLTEEGFKKLTFCTLLELLLFQSYIGESAKGTIFFT